MEITRLKINGMEKPFGLDCSRLVVSWNVESAKGYQPVNIIVEAAERDTFENILFKKEGCELSCMGTPLEMVLVPRKRYFVRVTVKDDSGDTGTGVTWFETGKSAETWRADWIGMQEGDDFHPIFVKRFKLRTDSEHEQNDLVRADLYICGLGLYEAYINDKKIGEEFFAPFVNDYRFALQTQSYEVTDLLKNDNTLEIWLGNGWYKGRFGQTDVTYGERFAVIAELYLEYSDGCIDCIVTDESWNYRGSDIESSGIYDGEVFNRLLWEGRDNQEKPVTVLSLDKCLLTDRYSMPVKVKETLPVQKILTTPAGETVLDMGQNFAGWIIFHNSQKKGNRIHLEFGEVLQDGNFYNENYRSATGGFTYISNGKFEIVRPHFTWFGFRYVRVTGWEGEIHREDFTGCVIYSDLEQTGYLECGNVKINRLIQNCLWGQKSNFLDMPTDCPQRDERLGWTADAQVFSPTATYNMDTRAFYRKYLWDMRNVQKTLRGGVPAYLPANDEGTGPICSIWGDAAVLIPWTIWKFYADREAMKEYYPLMKNWVDYVADQLQRYYGEPVGIWDFTFQFGDWLALDGKDEQSMKGATSDGYLATMYYYQSVHILSEISEIIGKTEEAVYYKNLADRIRECIFYNYFTPAGHLSVNTQSAYIVALKFKVYHDKEVVLQDLEDLLELHQYKIKCGFVGAPLLCQTLSECGRKDIAYDFLFSEDVSSWLYAVNLGATTIWERWDSLLPDGSISGTTMNSLNHYTYGSVIEFLYAYAAGLRPEKAGFDRVVIAPVPDRRMGWLNCTYMSPAGKYVVNWDITDPAQFKIHLEIPFGCTAIVTLPDSEEKSFEVITGSYDYIYSPNRNYSMKYSENSFLKDVFADDEARTILINVVPQAEVMQSLESKDARLSILYDREFIGVTKEMADEALRQLAELR